MKKTLVTLALVAASVAAFGQGKVTFGNDSLHYFVLGTTLGADAGLGGGSTNTSGNTASGATGAIPVSPLPSGDSLVAVLYGGASAGTMTLQTSFTLTGANWLQAGRMASKPVTLSFAGGSSASFEIVVTDSGSAGLTQGALFSALVPKDYIGESGVFTATAGTSIQFPSLLPGSTASSTWGNANLVINAVPEPASFALFGLGAAAMLIFRRRK